MRGCSQPQTEVMEEGPTAMHEQVKKLFCHAEIEETRKFFKSDPRAVITAGRSCPEALLLYMKQHARGEAAALQTSTQYPGTDTCSLGHWITAHLTSSQWERQSSPQKPDSAGFKYTNRTAGAQKTFLIVWWLWSSHILCQSCSKPVAS